MFVLQGQVIVVFKILIYSKYKRGYLDRVLQIILYIEQCIDYKDLGVFQLSYLNLIKQIVFFKSEGENLDDFFIVQQFYVLELDYINFGVNDLGF